MTAWIAAATTVVWVLVRGPVRLRSRPPGRGRMTQRALWRPGRLRRAAALRAEAVVEACDVLAAELRAGRPPDHALRTAAADWPDLAPAADAARLGASVPSALRLLAGRPGARSLAAVAAGWAVAEGSGSSLARTMELAAAAAREDLTLAGVVAVELAAARATARLLALLPVAVLLLGRGVGGDPIGFLVRSPAGGACLVGGVLFEIGGLVWLERISHRALDR